MFFFGDSGDYLWHEKKYCIIEIHLGNPHSPGGGGGRVVAPSQGLLRITFFNATHSPNFFCIAVP